MLLSDSVIVFNRKVGTFQCHATHNDIVVDIVDDSSSTMAFNVAKIASSAHRHEIVDDTALIAKVG